MMTKYADLKARLIQNPEVQAAYDDMQQEFAVAEMLIAARTRAGLSQQQVAERMKTTQSSVARLESGKRDATLKSLRSYAEATGTVLRIELQPDGAQR